MYVRIAKAEDFDEAFDLAWKFISEAYGEFADEQKCRDLVVRLIEDDDKVFLLREGGFCAGVINQFILGNKRMAVELGWYVDPSKRGTGIGKALMNGFEDWATIMDCDLVSMISIDDEIGDYYEKRGYKLYERTYMKEL